MQWHHGSRCNQKQIVRLGRASSVVELPVGICILFLFLLLPMIDLATIATRASFIHSACHDAAHGASRAKSYKINGSGGELSAVNIARRNALLTKAHGLAGVNFADSDVHVFIIGTPIKLGKPPIRQEDKLDSSDTKSYLYQVEVSISGTVDPLAMLSAQLFGSVPGLTVPMPVQATYREFSEHPSGLTK